MFTKRNTYIVLGIFLILTGLMSFISGLGALRIIVAILALAAGIMILISTPGVSNNIGWILAAIYLIMVGLTGLVDLSFSGMGTIMGILAMAAGVVLLIGWPGFSHHVGFILFCVWLILVGLARLVGLGDISIVSAIIAIASGILIILNE
ncbi:MAG: hypothetical protein ACOCYU_03195 [Brevefilum sp.]